LGFSQLTLTLIYAAYVIGNLAALLFVGRASDRLGRRVTALPAIGILILAALVFLFADGLAALYIGRILTGLGIGIASGTGNAWLADLVGASHGTRAATIGTATNFLGLGVAPLLSGLLAQYAPWPLHLSSSSIWSCCARPPCWSGSRRKPCGGVTASPSTSTRACRCRARSACASSRPLLPASG
jgi:MFS family permease